jgi:5' nucleotidase, deoxy (Pyrimidine), cytosolic type C protein (NT5C)
MKQQKKAVIDIDNTLWHFCDVLFERLQKINNSVPSPDQWVEWDFWENFCSKEEFLGAIKDIHLNQDDDRHLPYPEAKDFLATLKEHDFHITIASHRTPDSIEETHRWLVKHELVFDEVHLSYDKTVLIDDDCHVVVDDAPHILEKAAERGVPAAGLLFPWNQSFAHNGYKLFRDLNEVLTHILLCKKSFPGDDRKVTCRR